MSIIDTDIKSEKSRESNKSTVQTYARYKDSGVEWLGEIPEHWDLRRIKYLFNEINERSDSGEEDLLSVSQYTGVTNKSDKIEEDGMLTNALTLEGYKKVKEGDLVSNIMLAWNGSLGFSPFDGITSPAYSIYRLYGENHNRYFHYLLRTELYKAEFKRNSSGVIESRLRLYTDDFFNIFSILPPLPEQTAIAQFLDDKTQKIDQAIGIKEQQIALLKERKQILIHKAVTRGLDDRVALKDSGVEWIGEIPEHWEVKKLGVISEVIDPQPDHRAPKMDENGLPYLGIRDINEDGSININTARMVEVKAIEKQESSFTLNDGDILYGKVGTLGNPKRVKLDGKRVALSATLVIIKTKSEIMSRYLKFALDSSLLYAQIQRIITGATRPALGIQQIRKFRIVVSNDFELIKVVEYLEFYSQKIDTAISLKIQEIEKLKEYKSSLINSVVTGKVKVS